MQVPLADEVGRERGVGFGEKLTIFPGVFALGEFFGKGDLAKVVGGGVSEVTLLAEFVADPAFAIAELAEVAEVGRVSGVEALAEGEGLLVDGEGLGDVVGKAAEAGVGGGEFQEEFLVGIFTGEGVEVLVGAADEDPAGFQGAGVFAQIVMHFEEHGVGEGAHVVEAAGGAALGLVGDKAGGEEAGQQGTGEGGGEPVAANEFGGDVGEGVAAGLDGGAGKEAADVGRELEGEGVAAFGVFPQGHEKDVVKISAELALPFTGFDGFEFADVADEGLEGFGVAAVGRLACQHLIEDDAEGVNIRGGGDGFLGDLFRAGVAGCEEAHAGDGGRRGIGGAGKFGDAEVEEFGGAFGRDEDVAGFEIAMDDHAFVGVLDGGADLLEELEPGAEGELALLAVFGDGLAFDEFHDEVGEAVFVGAAIEEAGDVGVVEGGEDLPFEAEAGGGFFRVQPVADEFDGDGLAIGVVVAFGAVDLAHAAAGDEGSDAIGPEAATKERVSFGALVGGQGIQGGAIPGAIGGGLVQGEETEDLFAKVRFGTFAEEEGVPLVRGEIGSQVEEMLDAFAPGHTMCFWSQALAKRQSRSAVAREIWRTSATSGRSRPPKKWSSTTWAARAYSSCMRVRAWSTARTSTEGPGMKVAGTSTWRLAALRLRAWSMRMRRIILATTAMNWPRPCQGRSLTEGTRK